MSDEGSTSSRQNVKVAIGTAVIAALGTIVVAFVNNVPNMLHKVPNMLHSNGQETVPDSVGTTGRHTLNIRGAVKSDDGSRSFDIYLLPEGSRQLAATTDDRGNFAFQGLPDDVYSIIVRNSSNGRSGKGLLDDTSGRSEEVQVNGASVEYRIDER